MQKVLLIDPEKCTGCRICEIWCSFFHERECNPSKARIHVIKWEERGLDVPMVCQQCEIAVCQRVCPVGAIIRDSNTGAVIVNEDLCIGCRICLAACPFGGCSINLDDKKVIKCDLCGGNPKCSEMCPREAIQYIPATRIVIKKKRASATKLSELIRKIAIPE